jgi:cbb3-type cytochrome oxidase cytochrome c subunit/mono/diheme cytochrome c family protein
MSDRQTDRKAWVAVIVVITATYGYFLIFAQFAFLELLRAKLGDGGLIPAMGAMGVAGVAGSLLAAWLYRPASYVWSLRLASLVCAGAAAAAWAWPSAPTAGVVGLTLGWLTVTLASGLRAAVGVKKIGRAAGLGTGLAYALCNLPTIFLATPEAQTAVAAGLMLVSAVATRWLKTEPEPMSVGIDYQPKWVSGWALVFMALVWLDSAAFYIIQHTPFLRHETWEGQMSLWMNAIIHLFAAMAAGELLDRGWLGRVTMAAWVGLAVACVLLVEIMEAFVGAEMLYTAAVSLYSVALVYYPARGGRPWVAGTLFALAGWVGSALGIGMAQDLHTIPPWFIAVTGALIVGIVLVRQRARFGMRQPVMLLALLGLAGAGVRDAKAEEPDQAVRGREVFIAEGCMHCHSQYVRPGTIDAQRWGPEKPLAEMITGSPPLPGNRRQGPDLTQVGNRRSPEWNRLHLIEPREVSPGSRMPSYAHLFRAGDERGQALVEYLGSLGADTMALHLAQVQAWSPPAEVVAEPARGAALFSQLCVNCHGAEGRGDGPLAAKLSVKPPDWTKDAWRYAGAGDQATVLARIIKFGVPGSPMAGHEYLRDVEVVSLARHVAGLHTAGTAQ